MKRTTFTTPALMVLLAIILAACPSDQGASAAPASEPEAAPESQEAAGPSFDLPQSAPELAALLPDEIGGQEATKFSFSGPELLEGGEDVSIDPETVAFLERLDAEPDDISFAMSLTFDADGNTTGVVAFRVEGASEDRLESEFRTVMDEEGQPVDWEETSLAGKDVFAADDPDNPGNTMYLYTRGDIMFLVTAADESTAEEVLEDLP